MRYLSNSVGRGSVQRLATVLGLVVALVTGWAVITGHIGFLVPRGGTGSTRCLEFGGEVIDSVAWDRSGSSLAVRSHVVGDGAPMVRWVGYPARDATEISRSGGIVEGAIVVDDRSSVYWVESKLQGDLFEASIWTGASGGSPRLYAKLPHPRFSDLTWTPQGILALESNGSGLTSADQVQTFRVVRIGLANGTVTLESLTDQRSDLVSYWASSDGLWLALLLQTAPGDPVSFLITNGTREWNVSPDGGATLISLSRDHKAVVYVTSETARLVALDLETRTQKTVSTNEYSGGAVSTAGVLAGITPSDPGRTNSLCLEALP